ncbi:MAG: orotidine-5'-phosphate decarboxylase [Planctomycetota bacterium]
MAERFSDRLCAAIDRVGAPLCVGLDPVLERMPEDLDRSNPASAFETFCAGIIDAVSGVAAAIKPQSACFERYGSVGVAALERVIAKARDAGLVVVLDVKRGDIGLTASHYAAAAKSMGADAVTVSPYMGTPSIDVAVAEGLGVFALVRTSNPEGDELQSVKVVDGATVAEKTAELVARAGGKAIGNAGLSDVGAVVGATKTDESAALRAIMPDQIFLVPGIGAQGGTVDQLRPMLRPTATDAATAGVLVTASRSVIYAEPVQNESRPDAVRRAAEYVALDLRGLLGGS